VDTEDFDFLLPPVVQSGGEYDVNFTTPGLKSNTKRFSPDVVVYSHATRYKQHRCARRLWTGERKWDGGYTNPFVAERSAARI
jgi:nucleosome binding factor SPN SPT16 subunit